jgi:hypothetical protein
MPAKTSERAGVRNPRKSTKKGYSPGVVDTPPPPASVPVVEDVEPEPTDMDVVRVLTPLAIAASEHPTMAMFAEPSQA